MQRTIRSRAEILLVAAALLGVGCTHDEPTTSTGALGSTHASSSSVAGASTAGPGTSTRSDTTPTDGSTSGRAALSLWPILTVMEPAPDLPGFVVDEYGVGFQPGLTSAQPAVVAAEARRSQIGTWTVEVTIDDGDLEAFRNIVNSCETPSIDCPTGQVLVMIGDQVVWTPSVEARDLGPTFQIGGEFTEAEARRLAEQLQP